MTNYRHHPAAALFPMLPDAELDALADDIRANGQTSPVLLVDGKGEWLVLDGRNRLEACRRAGVHPKTEVVAPEDPIAFVLSLNLHRRHLTESQRSMVASRVATLRDGQRSDRGAPIGAATQGAAAELLSVGKRNVQRARQVLDNGAPELVSAVDAGTVKVSDAAAVAKRPHDEQRAALAKVEAGEVRTLRAAVADEALDDDDVDADEGDRDSSAAYVKVTPEWTVDEFLEDMRTELNAMFRDFREHEPNGAPFIRELRLLANFYEETGR